MEPTRVVTKTKWSIDPAHSEIGFSVKHLMFSKVRGRFKEFEAQIFTTGDDFMSAEIDIRIRAASIDTNMEQRDQHLRSVDFFDSEQFHEIRFTGRDWGANNHEGHHMLSGELQMKGIKKPVNLHVEFGPRMKDPWGVEKALFNINAKINRKDWGLNYNSALETGGVLISEDVWIHCEVQLIKSA